RRLRSITSACSEAGATRLEARRSRPHLKRAHGSPWRAFSLCCIALDLRTCCRGASHAHLRIPLSELWVPDRPPAEDDRCTPVHLPVLRSRRLRQTAVCRGLPAQGLRLVCDRLQGWQRPRPCTRREHIEWRLRRRLCLSLTAACPLEKVLHHRTAD